MAGNEIFDQLVSEFKGRGIDFADLVGPIKPGPPPWRLGEILKQAVEDVSLGSEDDTVLIQPTTATEKAVDGVQHVFPIKRVTAHRRIPVAVMTDVVLGTADEIDFFDTEE